MRGLGTDDHPPFLNRDLATGPAALTRDDVEVCRLAVQLALHAALHGCHRELVPPPWQQIPNRVGHQLPVGDVAALGALACGHIDDICLQRCAWSWCVPEYVGRGGCDSGGGQVCWRQGTWTRHGQQEVKGRVDAMWDLRGVAEAASEARSVTWTKVSELRPGHVKHCSPVDRPHTRHPLGSQCQSPAPQLSMCLLGGPWTVDKQPGARGGRVVPAGPALHRPAPALCALAAVLATHQGRHGASDTSELRWAGHMV